MSACYVIDEHINTLIECAIVWDRTSKLIYRGEDKPSLDLGNHEGRQQIAEILRAENLKSLYWRYEDPRNLLPDDVSITYKPKHRFPTEVQALVWLSCYEYQSCEHPDWPMSDAKTICDSFRSKYIWHLPGAHKAAWDWDESKLGEKRITLTSLMK